MTQPVGRETPALSSLHPDARDGRRRRFFVAMASILVVIVAVGFAPSFYLKTYFESSPSGAGRQSLPIHVYAHGVVLTLWFSLFLVQTILAASRLIRLHRLVGVVGAGLAAAVFTASMLVVVRLAARATARGVPSGRVALIVTGDTGLMILFALFVVAAISFRRRPEFHKRLMLLASITIVAPALARLPGAEALVPVSVVVPQLVLFAALVAYDVVSSRRVHPATGWGVALYVVVAVTSTAVGFSEFGRAFVRALA
jgi:hypothetical protein